MKKKKLLPFHAKVAGGAARRRPDRKARGGSVSRADAEPISPTEPNAPAGGRVAQKFDMGGAVSGSWLDRAAKKPTDILKEGMEDKESKYDSAFQRKQSRDISRKVRPGLEEEPEGRADGGDVPLPKRDPRYEVKPGEMPKSNTEGLQRDMDELRARKRAEGPAQVPELAEREKGVKQPGFIRPAIDAVKGLFGKKNGGPLSSAQRQAMPKSDFALPGKGEGPKGAGSGSYPINDPNHARNALARSSGKPEAAEVRRKVKAKYPDIG